MTTKTALIQESSARPPAGPVERAADPIAEAMRRFALTGDDTALVALGVLPAGKPLTYEPE